MIKEITIWELIKYPKMFWARSFEFFTNWVLLLVVLNKWTSRLFDLHTLVIFITLTSSFITLIHPKCFIFKDEHGTVYIVRGSGAHLLNIVFHVLPMLYVLLFVKYEPNPNMLKELNSFVLIFIYICIYHPEKIYRIKIEIIILFYVIAFLIVKSIYKD